VWKGFEVEYRVGSALYRCRIENPDAVEQGVAQVWVDGTRVRNGAIPLRDDAREHAVRVVMGRG
jgi:cellobiose phosphorylase